MNWKQKIYESVIDVDKPTKPKPKVSTGDPHASLPAHIKKLIAKRKKS